VDFLTALCRWARWQAPTTESGAGERLGEAPTTESGAGERLGEAPTTESGAGERLGGSKEMCCYLLASGDGKRTYCGVRPAMRTPLPKGGARAVLLRPAGFDADDTPRT
jgi:hypothetical protein